MEYLRRPGENFLAVATPGAGKTTFALRIAAELLADGTVDAVTVVTPDRAPQDPVVDGGRRWSASSSTTRSATPTCTPPRDFHGAVVTYAQVGMAPAIHRRRTMTRKTLVILDEIHHAGDSRSWGDGVKAAFEPAVRRLMLTGTPFRSDDNPIPFVDYERGADGLLRSRSDSSYGYADALADGVVRPVIFLAYSGETRWRTSAGEELAARLGEPMTQDLIAQAWRTALDPTRRLDAAGAARGRRPPAGAAGGRHGRRRRSGDRHRPADGPGVREAARRDHRREGRGRAVRRRRRLRADRRVRAPSTQRWMVAVRMVSEGVDIPRLAVGVYATSASTPLFFAQAIGRFVRARQPGETASIFLPSVGHLLELASDMEVERDHVLGAPEAQRVRRRPARAGAADRGGQRRAGEAVRGAVRDRRTRSGDLRRRLVRHAGPVRHPGGGGVPRPARPAERRPGRHAAGQAPGRPAGGGEASDGAAALVAARAAAGRRARAPRPSAGSCSASSSTRSSRRTITAPSCRTARSTPSCAGSAAGRRARRPPSSS